MNFPNNSNPNPFNYMNSQNGHYQGGQSGFPQQGNGQGFPNGGGQQSGFPSPNFPQQGNGQGFPQPPLNQPNQQGFPPQGYPNEQQGYNVPNNNPYPGYQNPYEQSQQGIPPGYYGQQPPQPPQEPNKPDKKKKKKDKKKQDMDVFHDPNLANSYKGVEHESMEEYYQFKESRKKLYLLIGICSIVFIFVLGAFSTQFINGDPVTLSEEAREILSYSDDIKDKTSPLFAKDREHYEFANGLANQTISSNVGTDNAISKEISKMEVMVEDLKKMDKGKQVPVGFEGDAGLHQQITGLLEMRIKLLGNIRQISQGQRGQINKFNDDFAKYIQMRNAVITHFNQKYEYNFHTGLFDTKELEF